MMATHSQQTPQKSPHNQWFFLMRWTMLSIGSCLIILLFASLIFWDANFYAARDRWEHFKLAMLGDWQNTGWCPPGKNVPGCKPRTDLEAALSKVDNLHFFKLMPIEGTTLSVTTGANFSSAEDVVTGKISSQWCYIAYGDGAIRTHLDLAEQSGTEPTRYENLLEVNQSVLIKTGLNVETLRNIAKTHCQFGAFNQPLHLGEQ